MTYCISPSLINGERCINEASFAHGKGNPKYCSQHFSICSPLYEKYKGNCRVPKTMPPCTSIENIEELTLEELKKIKIEIMEKYVLYKNCLDARENFKDKCIFPACEDCEHKFFYNRLYERKDFCEDILTQINNEIIRKSKLEEKSYLEEELKRKKEIEKIERQEQYIKQLSPSITRKSLSQVSQCNRQIYPKEEEILQNENRDILEEKRLLEEYEEKINLIEILLKYFDEHHINEYSAIISILNRILVKKQKSIASYILTLESRFGQNSIVFLREFIEYIILANTLKSIKLLTDDIIKNNNIVRISSETFNYFLNKLIDIDYTDNELIKNYQMEKSRDFSPQKDELANKIIELVNKKYHLHQVKPVDTNINKITEELDKYGGKNINSSQIEKYLMKLPKSLFDDINKLERLYSRNVEFINTIRDFIARYINISIIEMAFDKLLPTIYKTGKPIEKLFLLSFFSYPELQDLYDIINNSKTHYSYINKSY